MCVCVCVCVREGLLLLATVAIGHRRRGTHLSRDAHRLAAVSPCRNIFKMSGLDSDDPQARARRPRPCSLFRGMLPRQNWRGVRAKESKTAASPNAESRKKQLRQPDKARSYLDLRVTRRTCAVFCARHCAGAGAKEPGGDSLSEFVAMASENATVFQ